MSPNTMQNRSSTSTRARSLTLSLLLVAMLVLAGASPVVSANSSAASNDGHLPVTSLLSWLAPDTDPMLDEETIPGTSAASMLAVDITSDKLLYQYDANSRVAPASTLKIVTALTALTALEPEDVFIVSGSDLVDTTVYSNAQLQAGDQISVEDLLAGLMLPSGGDAAKALARIAGGYLGPAPGQSPTARFVEEMNNVAESIGMIDSNFVNPDGPDDPEQYSTARDMAIAGAELLQSDLLSEIVSSSSWDVTITGENARQYTIENTNALIGADRVHGIKTGTTGEAGQSIILATRRGGNQVVTVVMGSDERYGDIEALMSHLDDEIRWIDFGPSSDFPEVQDAEREYRFSMLREFTEPVLRSNGDELSAEIALGPLTPIALPLRWGVVVFLQDGEELYQVPLLRTPDSQS